MSDMLRILTDPNVRSTHRVVDTNPGALFFLCATNNRKMFTAALMNVSYISSIIDGCATATTSSVS